MKTVLRAVMGKQHDRLLRDSHPKKLLPHLSLFGVVPNPKIFEKEGRHLCQAGAQGHRSQRPTATSTG